MSSTAPGGAFERLVDLMRTLRGPDGCPWDREQTLASLRPYVIEEAYEVIDAIDRGDRDTLCGEIGDLVFEGVFLAQICAEDGDFTIGDALERVHEKLVRRHPHVFDRNGGARADTPGQVKQRWDEIKAEERAVRGDTRRSVLDGLPPGLPALHRAGDLGRRAATVGFDWPRAADVIGKIDEEVAEVRQAVDAGRGDRVEEEIGDLLFAIANLARKLGVEPEGALRRANAKFTARFAAMEARLEAAGRSPGLATLEELEAAWETVKRTV